MNKKDNIEQLFKDKLTGYQPEPPKNAWSNIQTQIGQAPASGSINAAASKGLTTAAKWLIISSVIVGSSVAGYFLSKNNTSNRIKTQNNSELNIQQELTNETTIKTEEIPVTKNDIVNITNNKDNFKTTAETSQPLIQNNTQKEKLVSETTDKGEKQPPATTFSEIKNHPTVVSQQNNTEVFDSSNNESSVETPTIDKESTTKQNNIVATNDTINNMMPTVNDFTKDTTSHTPVLHPIPNVFTPNYDGKNDILKITGENIDEFKASVYDINGNLIFEWNSTDGFWDGNDFNGNQMPNGAYPVIVVAKSVTGEVIQQKTIVNLFR